MDLRQLKSRGGFVSPRPVPVEVEWTHTLDDGQEVTDQFTVHVLRQSFGTMEELLTSDDDRSKSAAFIASCVRFGEAGKERMSYDDAYQLDPGLAAVLIGAIYRINGTGGQEKNSPPPKNSGAISSPEASADEPSQKPSSESVTTST